MNQKQADSATASGIAQTRVFSGGKLRISAVCRLSSLIHSTQHRPTRPPPSTPIQASRFPAPTHLLPAQSNPTQPNPTRPRAHAIPRVVDTTRKPCLGAAAPRRLPQPPNSHPRANPAGGELSGEGRSGAGRFHPASSHLSGKNHNTRTHPCRLRNFPLE